MDFLVELYNALNTLEFGELYFILRGIALIIAIVISLILYIIVALLLKIVDFFDKRADKKNGIIDNEYTLPKWAK